jgi:hypothetical protein
MPLPDNCTEKAIEKWWGREPTPRERDDEMIQAAAVINLRSAICQLIFAARQPFPGGEPFASGYDLLDVVNVAESWLAHLNMTGITAGTVSLSRALTANNINHGGRA